MKLSGQNKIDPNFNLSSMTDIVFLLLIFFMLTTTIVHSNAVKVKLPQSDSRTPSPQGVTVTIRKDGGYFVNQRKTPYNIIADKLRLLLKGEPNPGFMLQAEAGTPIEKVIGILDIARKNRYKTVLATQPKP